MNRQPDAKDLGGDPTSPALGHAQKGRLGIRQAADDVVEAYIYGYIESDWYNYWTGEKVVSETSADYFKRMLFDEHPNAKVVQLYINSYGGSVFEATAIMNMLRRHPAEIRATIDGFAYSAAANIAAVCDHVAMPRNAMMMIHNAAVSAYGNAKDLREAADMLDKTMEANRTVFLEKVGDKLSEEALVELLDAETYFTADECYQYGFCDELLADKKLDDDVVEEDNKTLEQRLKRNKELRQALKHIEAYAPEQRIIEQGNKNNAQEPEVVPFFMRLKRKGDQNNDY